MNTMRKIKRVVRGQRAVDGAGVQLVRVLGRGDVVDFDPFLMLDSFDSTNPEDYIKGFPMHPHRGIETITYLIEGEMNHEDSLGNKGVIHSGESQWMTAGSGILHQEMPQVSPRMLGLQIWLNLSKSEKMTKPAYFDITPDMMGVAETAFGSVRVVAGEYNGTRGVRPPHLQASLYDVSVEAGKEAQIPANPEENAFIFLIQGDAIVDGEGYQEKSALLFGEGDHIRVIAAEGGCRFLFFSGKPLGEPIAWGGPIVMNTKEELKLAFDELAEGTFIRSKVRSAQSP